jgi:hypothetical protein
MLCSLLRGDGEVMREPAREVAGEVACGPAEGEGMIGSPDEEKWRPADVWMEAVVLGLVWDKASDEEDETGDAACIKLAADA